MRSFYAACDIVVLPSRSEGCPNVVLESMAMRRALVVSNAAGTREVVAHEREALVFPIGDIASLSDAVRRLIEQPELRRDAGDARPPARRERRSARAPARASWPSCFTSSWIARARRKPRWRSRPPGR